ncbi:RNA-binding domain-containing protein [Cryphonectria parasitica EP155]|uniref:Multiple RNA-binding domain-containing protein 1 n=1 Tax=Cryphonectria parasitica (strain ATCC 38755 / EP155) TaxID=660469 RepID=A0A9P4Y135_CRYP1|nr:RNA-binding domain-containing protein [Cryphonectria parasitica EP155]KAF3764558.1 RNA-binding domain-containing protein [Cryphonectria parasitica EP155]
MESSRLFVKNLPPTINESDFRKHFSTGGRQVTDVKLIAKRRIGYVGYKTPEEAAKAVKYFNKSYIRMSKISVEPARPISDPTLPTLHKIEHVAGRLPTPEPEPKAKNKIEADSKKRKREELDPADPKLREYLDVMRPGQTTSSKLEGILGQPTEEADVVLPIVPVEAESDDEYEEIPTHKSKRQKEDVQHTVPSAPPAAAAAPSSAGNDLQPAAKDAMKEPEPGLADATDDDWLRSRTNRLLDLVDPDDPAALAAVASRPSQQPAEPTGILPSEDTGMIDAGAEPESPDEPATVQIDGDSATEQVRRTARLFVRNLPFKVTEAELRDHFSKYGDVEELHVPVAASGQGKGFAHVSFADPESAIAALQDVDGKPFQGRLLHVIPGQPKKDHQLDEFAISQLPLKKQNLLRKKAQATTSTFNWNSLYMNQDAVLASTADRLGVSKSELLDPTSTDAAVKQAVAETQIITDTKSYFATHGVNLDAFKSQKKGDTAILVKNFPYGTTLEELRKLFEEAAGGNVLQVLMPPSKTIAIVQFSQPVACRTAFAKLAYRRMGSSILFLEKAPADLLADHQQPITNTQTDRHTGTGETGSLYVRNLNFDTTTAQLAEAFTSLDGFVRAQVKTKLDPKKPGQVLSMGFGFVHFRSQAQAEAALKVMDGYVLDGHTLGVKASHKGLDAAEERRREDKAKKGQRTKIVIKNLAFEASKTDLRRLLGTYGKLRVVRIPKKFGNSSRGFAFAEFESPRDAENCIKSLKDTHLLGRRLVLDYAEAEAVDAEEEIAKMQKKIGGQVNKVAVQKLTGKGARQRFEIGDENEDDA